MSARLYGGGHHVRLGAPVDGDAGVALVFAVVVAAFAVAVGLVLVIVLWIARGAVALGRIAVRAWRGRRRNRWHRWRRSVRARHERSEVAHEAAHRMRCERETGEPCPHVTF